MAARNQTVIRKITNENRPRLPESDNSAELVEGYAARFNLLLYPIAEIGGRQDGVRVRDLVTMSRTRGTATALPSFWPARAIESNRRKPFENWKCATLFNRGCRKAKPCLLCEPLMVRVSFVAEVDGGAEEETAYDNWSTVVRASRLLRFDLYQTCTQKSVVKKKRGMIADSRGRWVRAFPSRGIS